MGATKVGPGWAGPMAGLAWGADSLSVSGLEGTTHVHLSVPARRAHRQATGPRPRHLDPGSRIARWWRRDARRPLRRLVLGPGDRVAGGPGHPERPVRPDRGDGADPVHGQDREDHRLREREVGGQHLHGGRQGQRRDAEQPTEGRRPDDQQGRAGDARAAAVLGPSAVRGDARPRSEGGETAGLVCRLDVGRWRCLQEHRGPEPRSRAPRACSCRS